MKTIGSIALSIFIAVSSIFCGAFVPVARAEQIDDFDATIVMGADASISVTEKIDYDFGALERHGIYRKIPVRYEARGGNYNLRLSDISVTDSGGSAYTFEVSDEGRDKVLKIGDAGSLVTGEKTYVISYRVGRAINYFEDHDELYWNATGNGWEVPIERAEVRVVFPAAIGTGSASLACYAGAEGSAQACDSAAYSYGESGLVDGADFSSAELSAGQGLTVVAGIPTGIMHKPTRTESALAAVEDNWIFFLPLLVFAMMFCLWRKRGRDPVGRGTIIPEYDVPDQLTPAEVGTVVDEKCGQKEIVAEMIYLAEKGYFKIRREENKVLFVKTTDYVFERLKDSSDLLGCDVCIMNGLFHGAATAKLSELKKDFYSYYNDAIGCVNDSVYRKGYFSQDPKKTMVKYASYAVLFVSALLLLFATGNFTFGAYGVFAFILSGVIVVVFANAMPRKTERGVATKEYILGLKKYLEVAEKDRLEFHNAPEKNPEQFEKLLPYAIALGVEKKWAAQFEGILKANPSWYDDPRGIDNFSAMYLVSSLGDFKTDFTAAAATASSGGSGLGGGGFSGGGFGGGGGGSW